MTNFNPRFLQWIRRGERGGRRPDAAYLVLLLMQLYQQIQTIPGTKPPITLGLIALQVVVFLAPLFSDYNGLVPSIHSACLRPHAVLFKGQWHRLFLSAFLHADEHHLYYNMASLLWKGVQLEGSMSSAGYACLLAELLTVSHSLVVAASFFLAYFGPYEYRDLPQSLCAVGFSAVLFGMKVILNHNSPGWSNIFGIPLPTRFLCWGELILSSILFPQASFLGHLCGILAGFIHIKVTDPLIQAFSSWMRGVHFRGPRANVFTGRGRSGHVPRGRSAPRVEIEDQVRAPAPVPPPIHQPSQEEIRQLRLRRFE